MPKSKDDIIQHKKAAMRNLNKIFEMFINSPHSKHLKKADLIAYWLETYCGYLETEETFDYTEIMKFERGSIINVNFGFNVGSEHGGLHFAVVLDNDNRQRSPVITVAPLSSSDGQNTYDRDIFIGNELHDKLNNKNNLDLQIIEVQIDEYTEIKNQIVPLIREESKKLKNILNRVNTKLDQLNASKSILLKHKNKIDKMKHGSIILMEQITTISKMRIYDPKHKDDLLYNIKLSDGAMDKINASIKKLFLFEKSID